MEQWAGSWYVRSLPSSVSSFLCSGGNAAGLQTPVARQLNPKKGNRPASRRPSQRYPCHTSTCSTPSLLGVHRLARPLPPCRLTNMISNVPSTRNSSILTKKKNLREIRTPPRDHRQKPLYVTPPRQIVISPGDIVPALAFSSTGAVLTGHSITTQAISTTH